MDVGGDGGPQIVLVLQDVYTVIDEPRLLPRPVRLGDPALVPVVGELFCRSVWERDLRQPVLVVVLVGSDKGGRLPNPGASSGCDEPLFLLANIQDEMAFQTKALSDKGFHAHRFPASFQFGVELGRNRISLSADALLSDTHGHLQAFTHAATLLGDEPLFCYLLTPQILRKTHNS